MMGFMSINLNASHNNYFMFWLPEIAISRFADLLRREKITKVFKHQWNGSN
jgi:hypothetical protein